MFATFATVEDWKVILAVLLPLFCLALGAAVSLYLRHGKLKKKKQLADAEAYGTRMDNLHRDEHDIARLNQDVNQTANLVKNWDRERRAEQANTVSQTAATYAATRSPWRASMGHVRTPPSAVLRGDQPPGPVLLSRNTLSRAAPGLEHRLSADCPVPGSSSRTAYIQRQSYRPVSSPMPQEPSVGMMTSTGLSSTEKIGFTFPGHSRLTSALSHLELAPEPLNIQRVKAKQKGKKRSASQPVPSTSYVTPPAASETRSRDDATIGSVSPEDPSDTGSSPLTRGSPDPRPFWEQETGWRTPRG